MLFDSNPDGCASVSIEGDSALRRKRRDVLRTVEQHFDEHYDGLYGDLVLTGCQPADAEEHLQEAFLRLFRYLQAGHRVEKARAWLRAVLHHIQKDEWRRTQRLVHFDGQEMDQIALAPAVSASNPESDVLLSERNERMRRAMSALTERQHRYLLLRAEGLRLREIAELDGVTIQVVAEICSRALERLRRMSNV